MTVEELFKQLSYGELSNLAVAVDASGTIRKDQQNRIIHFANEALQKLHARFPLRETQEQVVLAGVAVEKTLPTDVLQITSILTPWGESLPVMTHPVPKSLYVYQGKLHIPAMTTELLIIYQHRHPKLTEIVGPTDLAQVIALPVELSEALTAYIAYKVYAGMNSQDSQNIAAMHRARYEQVLAEALNQGLLPGELLPVQKLDARGFV